MLAARGAGRRFGEHTALEPTTMEVREAEVVALLGPNGAGKSTLLALLAGGLEPSWGSIERRAGVRIGWTPQRPAHYGRLSAREPGAVRRARRRSRAGGGRHPRARPVRAAGRTAAQCPPLVGNRQRLNLAISLLGNPDVLLLDEPTASLDPPQRRKLWQTAVQHTQRGGAVVFATQNHEELEGHADRVLVLLEGLLVFDGPLDEYERTELARTLV